MKISVRISALVLALLSVMMLFACDGDTSAQTVDISAVKEQIISELGITDAMDLPGDRLLNLYGIETADIKLSASFVTMGGVFPDEVVMVEAVDSAAADRVEEKLGARLDEVLVQAQSYSPEDYAVAKECKVQRVGDTVAVFISKDHARMEEIFNPNAK